MSCFTTSVVYGQQQWSGATNTAGAIHRSGNVGIGTTTTPNAVLELRAEHQALLGGGFAIQPNLRLQSSFSSPPAATYFWDVRATNSLNFNYSTSANGTFTNLLSVGQTQLRYSGSRLTVGNTSNNEVNIGSANSPLNNPGHYIGFGASAGTSGIGTWSFIGSSSQNGGTILHSDNQGNFSVIVRPAGGGNLLNTAAAVANTRLFINGNGNIGIGTNAPSSHERLAVRNGMITTDGVGNGVSLVGSHLGNLNDFGTTWYGLFTGDPTQLPLSISQNNTEKPIVLSSFYGLGFNVDNGKMAFCQNGALVISTDNALIEEVASYTPALLEYKLFIEKGIRAERVRVDVKTAWFDYVFNDDYELPTLEKVEAFIKQNHHLPDIPSEQEVKTSGIDVAEMDGLLLKKIEELTLYTIEQQKQLKFLGSATNVMIKTA